MISKRLKAISELVDTESIIDVGADHALLDIYLTLKGIKCRCTDISLNCVKLSKENIKKHGLEDKINVYHTNGVMGVNILKTDTIVVAGMGTNTIIDIVKDLNNPLILLSNNDIYKLRKEITKLGYYIDKEIDVYDKKYYYVIIRFKKGYKKYKYKDYILGIDKSTNYYRYLYNKELKNYKNIPYKNIFKKIKTKRILIIINNKIKGK